MANDRLLGPAPAQASRNLKRKFDEFDEGDDLFDDEDDLCRLDHSAEACNTTKKATTTIGWLNSLDWETGLALRDLQRSIMRIEDRSKIPQQTRQVLRDLKAMSTSTRDGGFYLAWATYEVVQSAAKSSSHARFQVKLRGGPNSRGAALKAILTPEKWSELLAITDYAKFQAHHVGYLANRVRFRLPIPLDSGRGGSVSHYCDVQSCIRGEHLIAAERHVENMARQRCEGVILIHLGGYIVKEIPCIHSDDSPAACTPPNSLDSSERLAFERKILTSCIGVRLIGLDDERTILSDLLKKTERSDS